MSFYMNMGAGVLNEGEQLEKHNERKVKEKWAASDDRRKADDRRERVTSAYWDKQSDADKKRIEKEYNKYYGDRDINDSKADYATKSRTDTSILKRAAKDAGVRPKHEFGIFSECFFINEGEQKEDYIKRKYVDSYDKNKDDDSKAEDRRNRVTSVYYDKQSDADKKRIEKEYDKYSKDVDKHINDNSHSKPRTATGLGFYNYDTHYQSAMHADTEALKRAAKDAGVRPKR